MAENPNRAELARRVEKAEKLLQKGKTADALAEYLQILEADPQNDNVRQMAADLCLSLNKGAQAVRLLGELFERQVAATDATRASLTYKKLARYTNPSWEQKVRFGQLLEHSNKKLAIGTYENALEDLQKQGKKEEALLVVRRIVALEPSQANHLRVAELSANLGEHVMASASFLQLAELAELEAGGGNPDDTDALAGRLDLLRRRSRRIPYLDPVDVRYNRFQAVPKPIAQAVMFCLMDVSGSMTEHMKDLAKRFYVLLYLFLRRRYQAVDIVFIRHTHEAREVDEQTFFYSTETGGTVVSTALLEMMRVLKERYPAEDWNIYAAQASDGDNLISDNGKAAALLRDGILPLCQYFAYLEVAAEYHTGTGVFERDTELWRTYRGLAETNPTLAMRRVRTRRDIFPVFRELFSRNRAPA